MHDSIGVIQIDLTGGLVECNEALEELVAPWSSVSDWWEEVRPELGSVDQTTCPTCGQPELAGTKEVVIESPADERVDFRLSFHGHTHPEENDDRQGTRAADPARTSRPGITVGLVERGATELADSPGDPGLTSLSEATTPQQFEALGLQTATTNEGLAEDSSPGEIALAYVRRALSWPLRSALRQLEPLARHREFGVDSGSDVEGIYQATRSLLELVQNVERGDPDRKQREFLDALRSLATGMSQSLDIDQVADQIFSCFDDLLGFKRGAIVVQRNDEVRILADRGGGETLKNDIAPSSWLRGVQQAEPELIVADSALPSDKQNGQSFEAVDGDPGEAFEAPNSDEPIDAWIALPLVGRDSETFGCVGLQREHTNAEHVTIESYDRQLLSALADQAALAILNAWKYAEARREANTDPVTELYGRRYMERRTREAMLHAAQSGDALSLLMVDIDHFKQVNDRYGHVVGDAILEQVASRCRDVLRDGDLVGRYGGEEFICLLPGADLTAAREAGERLRRAIREKPFEVETHNVDIHVTVGVARFTDEIDDFDAFVERADSALYSAKRDGRDRVTTFEELSRPDRNRMATH